MRELGERNKLMKPMIFALGALVFLVVGCKPNPKPETPTKTENNIEHSEHSHKNQNGDLKLNNDQKWKSDAPLRKAMSEIKNIIAPFQGINGQTIAPEQAEKASIMIKEQIDYMVANCKLSTEADTVLHVILGEIISGANDISTPNTLKQGTKVINNALINYETYFD